jgi:H+-transporting ATPase
MLMLITLLNDGTLISIGYDRAVASARPERWNLRQVFAMAGVLGLVACLSSLLLLGACLDAGRPGSAFARLGLPAIEYGKIITLIYLKARPRSAPAHFRVGQGCVRIGSPQY